MHSNDHHKKAELALKHAIEMGAAGQCQIFQWAGVFSDSTKRSN